MALKRSSDGAGKKSPSRKIRIKPEPEKSAGREAAQADESSAASGDGQLVLVVDDYQDAREMCCEYLTYCGFRVAEARNGQEAVEKAVELLPDVILMDLSLPGMDGWEATRRLKADGKTKRIPVIALTGHALAGHSEGAQAAGCDAFITKPCMPDKLVSEVRRMLDDSKPDGSKPDGSKPKAKGRSTGSKSGNAGRSPASSEGAEPPKQKLGG
jgi:CheY-like chemotaxis protein